MHRYLILCTSTARSGWPHVKAFALAPSLLLDTMYEIGIKEQGQPCAP